MKNTFSAAIIAICIVCGASNKAIAQAYWHINGNSGTAVNTNFIGTTDNAALSFRTKNKERIRISPAGAVGIGISSPKQKLDVNGNINIAQGSSLFMDNHKVLGTDSAAAATFFGVGAGNNTISAIGNTATGYRALYSNTTGQYNTAVGADALFSANGGFNTATGGGALRENTTGWENTAIGYHALYNNTAGIRNLAVGALALTANSGGGNNVAIGGYALSNTTLSYGNVALGYAAGSTWNNGYYNVFIGEFADVPSSDIYNSIALGRAAQATAPNQARIGNPYTTSIGGYAGWSTISDGRVKKNIKENVPGLAFINKLKAVTYNLDLDAADKIVPPNPALKKEAGAAGFSKTDMAARQAKQQVVYTGFIAQDVEKAAKELGFDFSGVDAAKNSKDLYGLRYDEFVVPLVKAVQELSKDNEDLKKEVLAQKKLNDALLQRIERLEATFPAQAAGINPLQPATVLPASLQQNNPNPFAGATTIAYTLPLQYNAAKMIITDMHGNVIKEIKLSGNGKKNLAVDASAFPSGSYQYSLIIDGKPAGTKQMILAR